MADRIENCTSVGDMQPATRNTGVVRQISAGPCQARKVQTITRPRTAR